MINEWILDISKQINKFNHFNLSSALLGYTWLHSTYNYNHYGHLKYLKNFISLQFTCSSSLLILRCVKIARILIHYAFTTPCYPKTFKKVDFDFVFAEKYCQTITTIIIYMLEILIKQTCVVECHNYYAYVHSLFDSNCKSCIWNMNYWLKMRLNMNWGDYNLWTKYTPNILSANVRCNEENCSDR